MKSKRLAIKNPQNNFQSVKSDEQQWTVPERRCRCHRRPLVPLSLPTPPSHLYLSIALFSSHSVCLCVWECLCVVFAAGQKLSPLVRLERQKFQRCLSRCLWGSRFSLRIFFFFGASFLQKAEKINWQRAEWQRQGKVAAARSLSTFFLRSIQTHTLERTVCMCFWLCSVWSSLLRGQADSVKASWPGLNTHTLHLKRSWRRLPLVVVISCCLPRTLSLFALAGPYIPNGHFYSSGTAHTYSFHGFARTFIIFLSRRRVRHKKAAQPRPPAVHRWFLYFTSAAMASAKRMSETEKKPIEKIEILPKC